MDSLKDRGHRKKRLNDIDTATGGDLVAHVERKNPLLLVQMRTALGLDAPAPLTPIAAVGFMVQLDLSHRGYRAADGQLKAAGVLMCCRRSLAWSPRWTG